MRAGAKARSVSRWRRTCSCGRGRLVPQGHRSVVRAADGMDVAQAAHPRDRISTSRNSAAASTACSPRHASISARTRRSSPHRRPPCSPRCCRAAPLSRGQARPVRAATSQRDPATDARARVAGRGFVTCCRRAESKAADQLSVAGPSCARLSPEHAFDVDRIEAIGPLAELAGHGDVAALGQHVAHFRLASDFSIDVTRSVLHRHWNRTDCGANNLRSWPVNTRGSSVLGDARKTHPRRARSAAADRLRPTVHGCGLRRSPESFDGVGSFCSQQARDDCASAASTTRVESAPTSQRQNSKAVREAVSRQRDDALPSRRAGRALPWSRSAARRRRPARGNPARRARPPPPRIARRPARWSRAWPAPGDRRDHCH